MGNCLSRQTRRERQDTARSSHQLDSIAISSANQIDDSTHHVALPTATHLLELRNTNVCHSNIDKEGYKAMLACHDKLVTAIATDYLTIAGILLACGFISEEVSSKMLLPSSTPIEKATILVTALRERIKIAPQHFSELVRILSENTSTECIVSSLQSSFQGEIGCFIYKVFACIIMVINFNH